MALHVRQHADSAQTFCAEPSTFVHHPANAEYLVSQAGQPVKVKPVLATGCRLYMRRTTHTRSVTCVTAYLCQPHVNSP